MYPHAACSCNPAPVSVDSPHRAVEWMLFTSCIIVCSRGRDKATSIERERKGVGLRETTIQHSRHTDQQPVEPTQHLPLLWEESHRHRPHPSWNTPVAYTTHVASDVIPFNLISLRNKLVLLATWPHFVHHGFLFVQIFNLPLPVPGPNI